jgi:hypothetical protein
MRFALYLASVIVCGLAATTSATAAIAKFEIMTGNGVDLTLEMDAPINMNSTSAMICADTNVAVVEAKLWMVMDNGHQHGSTPTSVTPTGNHCYRVTAINFVMAGEWQIRVKLADGDRGTFRIPVEE